MIRHDLRERQSRQSHWGKNLLNGFLTTRPPYRQNQAPRNAYMVQKTEGSLLQVELPRRKLSKLSQSSRFFQGGGPGRGSAQYHHHAFAHQPPPYLGHRVRPVRASFVIGGFFACFG